MVAPSRRSPWPTDIRIGNQGLMLGRPDKDGPLVAVKAQPYTDQASPDQENLATSIPLVENTYIWHPNLGFGQKIQGDGRTPDQHSRVCIGADTSIDGMIMKGPAVTKFTPGSVDGNNPNGVIKFIESGGNLFAVAGRYWLKYVNDASWTVSKDFGVGKYAIDAEVFQSGGGTPANPILWAALNSTNPTQYSTDAGATWTAMSTHVNLAMATVGKELYRASSVNQLSKVDANSDPTVEANWTNANSFNAGDKQYPIQRIAVTALGYPLIFKTDGIYTIDTDGNDHHLFPNAVAGGNAVSSRIPDGLNYYQFGNDVHVTYGKQHVRLVPTISFGNPRLELQPIGPERFTQNDSDVRGRITAGVANGSLGAYVGLINEDTGGSYLLKFGSWTTNDPQSPTPDESSRIDSWHGSLTQPLGHGEITAMFRSSIGAPSGHYRCYIGFIDGTLAWFTMPNTPNPSADPLYTFDNTTDATVDFPLFHGGHAADDKSIRGFSITGTHLTSTESCKFNYKLDPTAASYTAFNNGAIFSNPPRQRIDFATGVKSALAAVQLVLHNTTTASSPIVTAVAIHYAVIPVTILIYSGIILASDGLIKRNASPLRLGSSQIRSIIKSAVGAGGTTVTLPDEVTKVVSFIDYGESLTWDDRAKTWSAGLKFTAVEYLTNSTGSGISTVYGTVARLQPYLISDLAAYSISDLGNL